MKRIIISVSLLLACLGTGLFAATKLPVVEILGQQYYVYEIKKGDSLFGIAREYGWDDSELKRLNPAATSPLKKGAKLYYPVAESDKVAQTVVRDPEEAGLLSPLKHKVKTGETVYSISRTYGIPVETIYKLNESSRKGIKAGEELLLRKPELRQNSDAPGYYTVKKGDTLYKVARENGVNVAAILKENPGVSENNFKAGSVIKLPPAGTGITMTRDTVSQSTLMGFDVYQAGKDESWDTIADRNDVKVEDLKEANPGVAKPKNKQLISIPKIETKEVEREIVAEDPREQSREGVQDIYEDVHRISDAEGEAEVRVAVVLSEPSAKKDLEFTRGFLTALDHMKRNSRSKVSLKVIEGTRNSTDVLNDLDTFKPSVLFITADNAVPEYLAEYSSVACIPLVNTFDVKSEAYTENPYLIQLLTPSSYFNEEIAHHIADRYDGYRLVFVGEEDSSDQIASSLRSLWEADEMMSMPDGDLSQYSFTDGNKYVIYGNPVKKADVTELLSSVVSAIEANPMVEIKVVGRPNWILYDEALSQKLHQADVMVPSRFYFDKDSDEGKRFIAGYRNLFDRTPVKSFPVYAAMGYDAASYFIPQLAATGGDINRFTTSDDTLQIPFRLRRPSNWTGLMNPAVYMVRFTPFDTIEKIVVE